MRRLRTISTQRLATIAACVVALATTAAIAQAALTGSGPLPAPKALVQAISDALGAPSPDGVTARISFTNDLLPSGSLPGTSSALTSGADGRLWLTKDGRLRLELQSDSGDVQVTFDGKQIMVVDSSANTVYKATLPEQPAGDGQPDHADSNPTIAQIQSFLDRLAKFWTVSGAQPTSTAGQPSYTVRISPKDDGGLLGAAEVAWDAVTGVPLRAAVYAQGQTDPVLELKATDISYGAVADSDVTVTPPAGAKVVDLSPPSASDPGDPATQHGSEVSGAGAVAKQLDFPLVAPDTLASLPLRDVHLVKLDGHDGALVTYGKGLGMIAVLEHSSTATADSTPAGDPAQPAPAPGRGRRDNPLPQINIDGTTGTEIATALGTIVEFERAGVSYVVAGSVPPVAAENAARGLK